MRPTERLADGCHSLSNHPGTSPDGKQTATRLLPFPPTTYGHIMETKTTQLVCVKMPRTLRDSLERLAEMHTANYAAGRISLTNSYGDVEAAGHMVRSGSFG